MSLTRPSASSRSTSARWWGQVKHLPFWCETCHGWHPLCEHADCRHAATKAIAARARQAITGEDAGA